MSDLYKETFNLLKDLHQTNPTVDEVLHYTHIKLQLETKS